MANYETGDIRNIALVGHGGSGKTTLVERLLVETGAKGRMGEVEDGSTTCDYEEEEKHHKHSLFSAVVHTDHAGKRINIVDTPGYPDFFGVAGSALPAVELAAIVIDASTGVQMNTRRMMAFAEGRNLPRMIIINKIDHDNIDLPELVEHIRETFGAICVPICLPTGGGKDVVDLLEETEGEADFSSVAEGRTQLMDQIVEVDEKIMSAYLEDPKSVSAEQLHHALFAAMREGHIVPIAFCSAKEGAGTAKLLHLFEHACPSPLEGNPRPFMLGEDESIEEWHAQPDPEKPAVAHVFKVTSDPFVGKLCLMRIHQGTVRSGDQLLMDDNKKPLRMGHLLRMQGKDHEEVKEAIAGDIVGVAKLDELHLNAVLHADSGKGSLRLKPLDLPKPMTGLAIEAKSRNDEAKIGQALQKMRDEDPTFQVERVAATHETVVRGLGELHLRVALERLKSRYGVEVTTHPPTVAYKETIRGKAEGHHRHKKQTGGAGQFGEVYLRVEPLDNGEAFEFVDDTFGGSVPKQYMPAIEKGVRKVMETGAFAGFPMTGVRVSVYDGKHHPVDSKEVAFMTAGKRAFIDAVSKAKPALLEPFVKVEITAPNSHMGDITADIAGKRGRIQSTDMAPGDTCVISAVAPLSELISYTSQLKSMTGGLGSFVMEYSHDEPTPPNVQQDVVASFKGHAEED